MNKQQIKGDIMEVQSSPNTASGLGQTDIIKKSIDVQEQQVLKILESASEQSKQMTAQKTGIGNSINITG